VVDDNPADLRLELDLPVFLLISADKGNK